MAGFAPTMGIIGTVMGLLHVLQNLSTPSTLGPMIAAAFTATLWGVMQANVFWLPLSNKLKRSSEVEVRRMELLLEGILAIQAGANPQGRGAKAAFLPFAQANKKRPRKHAKPPRPKRRPEMSQPRKRKKRGAPRRGGASSERWLLTYSDMITLLMVLFIVLFALGQTDIRKFNAFKDSFHPIGQTQDVTPPGGPGVLSQPSAISISEQNPYAKLESALAAQAGVAQVGHEQSGQQTSGNKSAGAQQRGPGPGGRVGPSRAGGPRQRRRADGGGPQPDGAGQGRQLQLR